MDAIGFKCFQFTDGQWKTLKDVSDRLDEETSYNRVAWFKVQKWILHSNPYSFEATIGSLCISLSLSSRTWTFCISLVSLLRPVLVRVPNCLLHMSQKEAEPSHAAPFQYCEYKQVQCQTLIVATVGLDKRSSKCIRRRLWGVLTANALFLFSKIELLSLTWSTV